MKTVDREEFIDWMLEDTEDWLANKEWILSALKQNGKVTVEDFFDVAGFVPARCIKEDVDDLEEFTPKIDCILEPFKQKEE